MKIVVDLMSGERDPKILLNGALEALEENEELKKLILVGDENYIQGSIPPSLKDRIEIHHSSEVIGMNEAPVKASRQKKESSVVIASKLVGTKQADGLFSPGNTGATVTSALLHIKRIEGVNRPAIAIAIPTSKGYSILLDAGATVDSDPKHIVQFALMGEIFARLVLGIENPKVGLLNIGQEDQKGNEVSRKAFQMLKTIDFNFIGNIEGQEIYGGEVDVIVCDGFIGNVILKLSESLAGLVLRLIKKEMLHSFTNRLGAFLSKSALLNVKERISPDSYGGAPLLGIQGCVMVGHGTTGQTATKNAILTTAQMIQSRVSQQIAENIREYNQV